MKYALLSTLSFDLNESSDQIAVGKKPTTYKDTDESLQALLASIVTQKIGDHKSAARLFPIGLLHYKELIPVKRGSSRLSSFTQISSHSKCS